MERVEQLDEESHRRYRRRVRLIQLLNEYGGVAQIGREAGTPKSHLSAMASGSRGLGDILAAKLESTYGKPEGWFDTIDLTETDTSMDGAVTTSHYTTKIDKENSASAVWPFDQGIVSQERYMALPTAVKTIVQVRLLEVIREEESRLSKQDVPQKAASRAG